MTTVTILGAGAWGSVLANLARTAGHHVHIWSRQQDRNLRDAIANTEVIVSAISMKGVVDMAKKLASVPLSETTIVVTATKGLDPISMRTPSQIWQTMFPNNSVVVLCGPNLSKEIEQGLPAATVVASNNAVAAAQVQTVFASDSFRVYTNADPLGTELGGTLKNVIAIAAGVCDGLSLGTNAKAALMTRALAEMIRIGTHLGARHETFYGLAGLGDLFATCNSPLSRNYQVGLRLAEGRTVHEILDELSSTAEGVNTVQVLVDLANQEGISVPIANHVYQLLNGMITPQEAVIALMERDLKPEIYDFSRIT